MTSLSTKKSRRTTRRRTIHVWLAASSLLAGCSSGTQQPAAPLPPAPAPSNATAYTGTQAPGLWTLSVDTTQNVFSYQSQAAAAATVSGGLLIKNGVLDFGNVSGTAMGRAVTQPAGGALLRPGGEATHPVAMIQQSDCFPVASKLRYIYAPMVNSTFVHRGQIVTEPGYGTFTVNTGKDGKNWNFDDLHTYVLTGLDGGSFTAGTEIGTDPVSFDATCSASGTLGTVVAGANPAFPPDAAGNPNLPNFHFNPAGAFVEDRSDGTSWVGFSMPQAAIKPSDVSTGTYRGFVSEDTLQAPADTRAVAFATPFSGSATLSGGVFPSEDLTAIPLREYSITLGAQDTSLNGVFPNATLTALDGNGYCSAVAGNDNSVKVGFDANGSEICTAAGVAVVSQLGGKYVIYFTSRDGTRESNDNFSYVIQFFLYQQ